MYGKSNVFPGITVPDLSLYEAPQPGESSSSQGDFLLKSYWSPVGFISAWSATPRSSHQATPAIFPLSKVAGAQTLSKPLTTSTGSFVPSAIPAERISESKLSP